MKKRILYYITVVIFFLLNSVLAQDSEWNGPVPQIADELDFFAGKFNDYTVVLEPDEDEPEWWAGAPSVIRDNEGVFWMACRMRSPEYPRGLRGYEIRILKSKDGIQFEKVLGINKRDIPIIGFERPALVINPKTRKFMLYVCGPWKKEPWCIAKFDDVDNPVRIDLSTVKPVIRAPSRKYERDVSVKEYKDPFVFYTRGKFHCYVIGYIRGNERIFHFESTNGEIWKSVGDVNQPVMDLQGWHNFFIRPASVLPLGIGYLFIYEGSSTLWYDPVYNIGTGFGFTFDLDKIVDLTTASPLALSTTPGDFHTFRYSHWMWVDGEIWVYAEVSRKNNSHEIRLFRIKM
jgi:hypothetical protein